MKLISYTGLYFQLLFFAACRREYTFGVNNKIRPENVLQQQEEQSENYFQTNYLVNQTANCLNVDSQSFSNWINDWYSTNNETCGQVKIKYSKKKHYYNNNTVILIIRF